MTHELKILPEYFKAVIFGKKTFELRKDDRGYRVNDKLVLREWNGREYTGRQSVRYVSYIYKGCGDYGLEEGYCILSLKTSPSAAMPH